MVSPATACIRGLTAKPMKMSDRQRGGRGGQVLRWFRGEEPFGGAACSLALGDRDAGHRGHDGYGDDVAQRAQRRRLQVQVGTGLQVAVGQAVADADDQGHAERDGLPAARGQQHAEERDGREDVAQPVDADQDGQPEREPGQRGQDLVLAGPVWFPGPVPVDRERVGQQAEAAEQQHLGQRLAERAAAGVLLGQAQRQHGRGGRGPAGSGQPPGQAAEREHRAPADHGRDQQGGVDAVQPDSRGEDERGPGHELGHDARAARVVVGAGEAQARVRAAERGRRVGNGQVAVVRDPVGDLEVGGGIAEVDDLLGTFGQLPDGEGYGDGDRGGQRPPRGCCRPGCWLWLRWSWLPWLPWLPWPWLRSGSGFGGLGFAAGARGSRGRRARWRGAGGRRSSTARRPAGRT